MFTEWIIDGLTRNYVHILKRRFVEEGEEKLQVGEDWRTSAQNNIEGRNYIKAIVPEDFYNSIISVWGDTPTSLNDETPIKTLPNTDGDAV